MKVPIYTIMGLLSLMILIGIVWRLFSRRLTLPCPYWLSWMVELDNPFTKTNRTSFIIEQLCLEPGMKVLDAGCGPGRLTIPIAKEIWPQGLIVAMDIQIGMLDRVRERAKAENLLNIRFLQAKIGDGKLEHDQYDRALLVAVLGEIPNRKAAFKEIFDALKSGGRLSVTELIFDPHFQGRRVVLKLAKEVGFHEVNFFGNRFAFTIQLKKP